MIETLINLKTHRETAINITQDIFSTMLAIEARPVERAPGGDQAHMVVGAIHYAGPWKGVLFLGVPAITGQHPYGQIDRHFTARQRG